MNMGMYWLFEYTWVCVFASVCLSVSLRLREDNGSGSAVRFFFYKMMVVMKVMKSREIIKIESNLDNTQVVSRFHLPDIGCWLTPQGQTWCHRSRNTLTGIGNLLHKRRHHCLLLATMGM